MAWLQGNLLDDTELIQVLANTKATAAEVGDKLAGAHDTERQIRLACEEFRPIARRATLLYFLAADFSVVNCMYQTSLSQVGPSFPHHVPAAPGEVFWSAVALHWAIGNEGVVCAVHGAV